MDVKNTNPLTAKYLCKESIFHCLDPSVCSTALEAMDNKLGGFPGRDTDERPAVSTRYQLVRPPPVACVQEKRSADLSGAVGRESPPMTAQCIGKPAHAIVSDRTPPLVTLVLLVCRLIHYWTET